MVVAVLLSGDGAFAIKRAGDRIKTDRRDAAGLARLHRAGELSAVWVPDPGYEAMHNLVRARLDAEHALRRARASSFPGSCCATAAIAGGRHGDNHAIAVIAWYRHGIGISKPVADCR
jgi:transposase